MTTDVATTAAQRISHQRCADRAVVLDLLKSGDPHAAYDALAASVELQALLAGVGRVTLPR